MCVQPIGEIFLFRSQADGKLFPGGRKCGDLRRRNGERGERKYYKLDDENCCDDAALAHECFKVVLAQPVICDLGDERRTASTWVLVRLDQI